jgi:hypothetical protein
MRFIFILIAALLLGAAGSSRALAQAGFDRPGGDYTSFPVRNGDPAVCAARCDADRRCRAWSFSYPATVRAVATCWLKHQVPPRVENGCCNSGVRGAGVIEPHRGDIEHAIDRHGGDYRNFEIAPDATGKSCQAACVADARCRAWTYVRQGYISPAARCFLKSKIKPPRRKPYAISGVVR